MAVSHNIVTIGTTATVISSAVRDREGHSVLIQNPEGGATVYIGGAGVTTSSYGCALVEKADISMDLLQDEIVYGVVASGTQAVNVLRTGN